MSWLKNERKNSKTKHEREKERINELNKTPEKEWKKKRMI